MERLYKMTKMYSKECISYDAVYDKFVFTANNGEQYRFHDKYEAIQFAKEYMIQHVNAKLVE
jgi:hypothetical protein